MAIMQFSHANGFPASSYSYVFELLPELDVHHINKMGYGAFPLKRNLHNFADELLDHIQRHHQEPVIGVGHSTGAVVTLLAAVKQPHLFKRVILLDPVLFRFTKRLVIDMARLVGMGDRMGPTRKALTRRTHFGDHDEARQYFGGKGFFRNFDPRCFEDYVQHGLMPAASGAGLELAISAQLEADIFRSVLTRLPRKLAPVPTTLVHATHHPLLEPADIDWLKRHGNGIDFVPFEGGHMFPLEQPQATADLIRRCM